MDPKEKVLASILLTHGKRAFHNRIRRASIAFQKDRPPFFVIGEYQHGRFTWHDDMNRVLRDIIQNHFRSVFGTMETIHKWTAPIVSLKDPWILAYLIQIVNESFQVILLPHDEDPHRILFAFVKVRHPVPFDMKAFDAAMFVYREGDRYEKHTHHRSRRTHRNRRSRRTHRNRKHVKRG